MIYVISSQFDQDIILTTKKEVADKFKEVGAGAINVDEWDEQADETLALKLHFGTDDVPDGMTCAGEA